MSDQSERSGNLPLVVCLSGPTAAGKTAVALELVKRFPFEIISVDSAMVYRHMNIGTAKPEPEVLARAPHKLVDILDPWETYSAGQFCEDARREINGILARGHIPLLVGGTFLYFSALEQGLADLPAADADVRESIDRRAADIGWPALHSELAELDPPTAARLKPADRQRIQRALEVIELTGVRLSDLHKASPERAADYEFMRITLSPADRPKLHARIEQRFSQMLAAGFLEEVESLRKMSPMSAASPSMRSVGYRQIWAHLDGETDLDEAIRRAVVATRRLVKRQLTWMRSLPAAADFDCLQPDVADQVVMH
ncbi:MAG: tRNA (adenosine(37)-N6)-dimethylallyltransferase MiaA, partial [Gammaproteobacteria bacterium]|nr:tRNA (adenosine(37)-N6)-dimethylallyltransferase MiaA [Gammaproteobacteria bacterium]